MTAAFLAAAVAAAPAFARDHGGDHDAGGGGAAATGGAATMGGGATTSGGAVSGNAGAYSGYKPFNGPGVIPHDAARNAQTTAPRTTTGSGSYSGRYTYNGRHGDRDRGRDRYARGGFGFGFYDDGYDNDYAYYPYDEGGYYGGDCYTRRVRIHHHWVWRRYCD
jgi:hypothetical protein